MTVELKAEGIAVEEEPLAREFVARCDWRYAKTMGSYNPHEYVVEKKEGGPDFTAFCEMIERSPLEGRYGKQRYRYVLLDGFVFWTVPTGDDAGRIVNRKPEVWVGWDGDGTRPH